MTTPTFFALADGSRVFIPKKHMKLHEQDLPQIERALALINANGESLIKRCVEFDDVVGKTVCVKTSESDDIVFATRQGRCTKTRFVLGRSPEDCRHVTVILVKGCDGYRLITGYIGLPAEKEVDDPSIRTQDEFNRALKFWSSHALVWGSSPVKAKPKSLKEFAC